MLGEWLQLSAWAGETRINISTALSLAYFSHRTHSPDNIIQFLIMCVCVAGDSLGLAEKNRGCSDKVRMHTTAAGN